MRTARRSPRWHRLLPDTWRGEGREARWRRGRARRILSIALVTLAVALGWSALQPAPAATNPVAVATRALPAGHRITAGDLRTEQWPTGARLPGRTDPASLIGQVVTGPVVAGEPVTSARARPSIWPADSAHEVAVTVPLADPAMADYLRAGDLVDVYRPDEQAPAAPGLRVIVSRAADATDRAGRPAVLVVAVPASSAPALAAAISGVASLGSGLVVTARAAS